MSTVLPKNSSGVVMARLKNPRTGVFVTTATVTVTLKRGATTVFSGRSMPYDSAGKMFPSDPDTGLYSAAFTAAEVATAATNYSFIVAATSGGSTFEDDLAVEFA